MTRTPHAAPDSPAVAPPVRRLSILAAEDDPVNQILLRELLEQRGHTVRLAGSGPEALAVLKNQTIDVLLLDVQLPGLNGFDVAARIRAEEKANGRRLPIVALTGRAGNGDRERCLEAGMDDYLSKPIPPEDLIAAIERNGQAAGALTAPDVPDPIDRAALMARLHGNAALLKKMARIFLDAYPQWLAQLHAAVTAGDAPQVQEAAHALKGSAGNFEAGATVAAALRLELMGRARDLTDAAAALRDLQAAIEPLRAALMQLAEAP